MDKLDQQQQADREEIRAGLAAHAFALSLVRADTAAIRADVRALRAEVKDQFVEIRTVLAEITRRLPEPPA